MLTARGTAGPAAHTPIVLLPSQPRCGLGFKANQSTPLSVIDQTAPSVIGQWRGWMVPFRCTRQFAANTSSASPVECKAGFIATLCARFAASYPSGSSFGARVVPCHDPMVPLRPYAPRGRCLASPPSLHTRATRVQLVQEHEVVTASATEGARQLAGPAKAWRRQRPASLGQGAVLRHLLDTSAAGSGSCRCHGVSSGGPPTRVASMF